jgi:hypothetical protein
LKPAGKRSSQFLESDREQWTTTRTDCGDGGDDFTELQLVEDGGFSGSIETDHENSHLLLSPETVEQTRECETHIGGVVDKSVVWVVVIWVLRSSLSKRTSDGQRTFSKRQSRSERDRSLSSWQVKVNGRQAATSHWVKRNLSTRHVTPNDADSTDGAGARWQGGSPSFWDGA